MAQPHELQTYLREAMKLRSETPCGCSRWELVRFFPAWRRALQREANPLADQRPWLTFPAIDFLARTLTPQMRVFEFGSGGSTLFFAQRAAEVVSVEHDQEWGRKVQAALNQPEIKNAKVILAPPEPDSTTPISDPADPAACVSSAERFRGSSFRNYVGQIEAWPDNHFDVVLVDGRARPACLHRALPKIKPGGWLLLDNAEREHYHPALAVLQEGGWTKRDLSGPGPYHPAFWRTWAWQKPVPERSFALDGLDLKLKPYLNFKRGFFVEAGANDGQTFSNTLYFETYLDWRGLLIEPIPELAEQCRRNRPRCVVENCALVSSDFQGRQVPMHYCNMMSLVKGAMKSPAADVEHLRKGCEVQRISSYELSVPAKTLTAVLDQHQVPAIDFLSLDVEGYEIQALQGLDFQRYQPKFMLIEARFREEIDAFLAARYEPAAVLSHHDVLYRRKTS